MSALEEQIAQLEAGIVAQEALRHTLGDAVVDAVIAALRAQLDALHAEQEAGAPPPGVADSDRLLEQLQSYLPQGLADKMRAMGRIEGERRQVTVLFADISGFTALSERLDPEEVVTLSNAVLKELAEAVYQYEGYVDKFLGDAVMAVFGAPLAHEDDAERALRCALDMRQRLKLFNQRWIERLRQPLALHAGVNTGMVIAGSVGSDLRMSYTVMGDTVNTASRLEDASGPDQILVSRDTYRLAREAFTFQALEPIQIKGKRFPLAVYELQRVRLAPGKARGLRDLAPAFVGREAEMAQLRAVMDDLEAGRGHILLVSGEAGIGKSRLMAEWRWEIMDRAYWAEGRCLPHTSAVSYGPFLQMIRHYAGIRSEQSEAEARKGLEIAAERFFPGSREARAVFADLLALQLTPEEARLLESLLGEQRRQRLFDLMEALFTRLASERPTVLVVEDMHWADISSLELVEYLLPLTQRLPLAVVGVYRQQSGEVTRLAEAQERYSDRFTAIPLSPLSETTSLEMVARLLAIEELPPALRRMIPDKAEGNPFFVEEVIRTLIEREALHQAEDGTWQATPLIETVTVPGTLRGLLMARLDRLPAETRWLAQQASVIGRIFLYRVLRHMAEHDAAARRCAPVDEGLSQMERDDLIRERARHPELEYMFRHALTQEVAYGSLLGPRRRELHLRVGETLEELFAGRLAEFTAVIGEHYLRGAAWQQAFAYLVQAGDGAARLHAYAEARLHYARALEVQTHLPDTEEYRRRRVDTILKQAKVSAYADAPPQVMESLVEAEQLAKVLPAPDGAPGGDRYRLAHVQYRIAHLHYLRNDMPTAIGYFKQLLAAAQEFEDPELVALPSFAIGLALSFQGHMGKAAALLGQAIPALEQTGNWTDWCRAVSFFGWTTAFMGDVAKGLAETQRALTRARELNSLTGISVSLLCLGSCHTAGEDSSRAVEVYSQAVQAARQSGDRLYTYIGYALKSWAQVRSGNVSAAMSNMAKSQTVAQELGQQLLMADIFAYARTRIALAAGQFQEALDLAEQTVSIAQEMGGIMAEGMVRRVWGQALAALGWPQWNEADAQFAESVRLLELGKIRLEAARTHLAWGTVYHERGDYAAARAHWEQAAAQWRASNIPRELAKVQALIAGLPEA